MSPKDAFCVFLYVDERVTDGYFLQHGRDKDIAKQLSVPQKGATFPVPERFCF